MNRRWIFAAEFFAAAAVVLGHNVWRILPNEVLILTGAALLSMRLHSGGWHWSHLGFRRPVSWRNLVLLALAAAALRLLLSEFAVAPLAESGWGEAQLPAGANRLAGDLVQSLLALLLVWTFAAFGEEIAYRGYLLERGAQALASGPAAYWTAALVSAVLFGYGHFYKGPAGILDSAVAGLVLAGAYLLSGRNLWTCVLAHGFIDTFAVGWLYLGLPE